MQTSENKAAVLGAHCAQISTHRVIQLSILLDNVSSMARSCRGAADGAAVIRNRTACASFIRRVLRLERIALSCSARLARA